MKICPLFFGDVSKTSTQLHLSPTDIKRDISLSSRGFIDLTWFDLPDIQGEYDIAVEFLYENHQTPKTFKAYRAAVEKLFLWAWNIKHLSIFRLQPADFNEMLNFYSYSPVEWQCPATPKRRLRTGELNPGWRPIVGSSPLSPNTKRAILSSLSAFYTFIIDNSELTYANPALVARKKLGSKKNNNSIAKKILSQQQVDFIMDAAKSVPSMSEKQRCRVRFLMAFLIYRYRRISEVSTRVVDNWETYTPMMSDFVFHGGEWFFAIPENASKSGVEGKATVPPVLLDELKIYRQALGSELTLDKPLAPLPTPSEALPLFPKINTKGRILGGLSTSTFEKQIKAVFLYAKELMEKAADNEALNRRDEMLIEAAMLESATPHWLRHTGISLEVAMGRDIVHVRDDAMHSSIDTTNIYTNALDKARSESAKKVYQK